MERVKVRVKRVEGAEDLPLPRYMTPLASGMDLYANIQNDLTIEPGKYEVIPTGIQLEIPPGFEAQVRPRSGLAARYGITLLNSPGTIDADYRGEVKVVLINHGTQNFTIKRGDRIAQLVIAPVFRAEMVETDVLGETIRGNGGFGHTGI
ncbi:dUTP diphosphatase [Thermosediminibacter oceani]|uniref:Deoxyuridine 5'-triphosphate nucleotidohydrolase n=1 Tax=Thermosediminibacter oceani (strain ATCC BAA-1034 / DSM 16646 / JW/IW-1228P) TaxID=555079 RepID=D9S3K8_THEOJ|nr:dUTP diphosphatase [Thermosediminibacter oceani]ADL07985.1 deoxyuridine 5'-triphosphate nucleotidohydrolase [Thermosediminibacter oceani DSM 16646]